MTPQHTPGPWTIDAEDALGLGRVYRIYGPDNETIVETDGGYYPPKMQDATLIAAAPEMLEALKLAYCQLDPGCELET